MNYERCPLNADGPFYTCGSCLACHLPEDEAPDLLAPLDAENWTTYFERQPATPDEVERACRAMEVCCLADLRYGGTDPKIINRLSNLPQYCDYVIRNGKLVRAGSPDEKPGATGRGCTFGGGHADGCRS